MKSANLLFVLLLVSAGVPAHEGSSEERALRLLALQQQLDKVWATAQREADPVQRDVLLKTHAQALLAVQEALRDAADKSPCVLLEAHDTARNLACLVDTEARLRATEKVLGHVIKRMTMAEQ